MGHRVSAVLLAAGISGRMGRPKQLLRLADKPLINHCLETILSSGIEDVIVVLGPDAAGIERTIAGMPVRKAYNLEPETGMIGSVKAGLASADNHCTAVLVCLSDHPAVSADTISDLVKTHTGEPDRIIIPAFRGRRGHPTLFPVDLLRELPEGGTLRDIIRGHGERTMILEVDDEGVILDIDTAEDYEGLIRRQPAPGCGIFPGPSCRGGGKRPGTAG